MTNVTYNLGIPDADNNPSVDQPNMKVNNDAVNTLFSVEHYGFNNNLGGQHKKIIFPENNTSVAQTDPASEIVTATGTDTTKSELYFRNANATFPLSGIKAAGAFTVVSGAKGVDLTNYNVASVAKSGANFLVTLDTTVTISNIVMVLLTASTNTNLTYSFTGNVLTIGGSNTGSRTINYCIMEF